MSRTPRDYHDYKHEIRIVDPSLSADGKLLLFSVSFEKRVHRLGQLNLETNELALFFDLDINRSWRAPVFSPDGKSIVASATCTPKTGDCPKDELGTHLVLIDVETHKIKTLTKGLFSYYGQSFSADGKNLTYAVSPLNRELKRNGFPTVARLNIESGVEEILFPTSEVPVQFQIPHQATEIGPDTYIFSATNLIKGNELKTYLKDLVNKFEAKKITDQYAYQLRAGKRIQPFPQNIDYRMRFLIASDGGNRMVFTDISRDLPFNEDGKYNWELFLLEGDTVKQLTNHQSLIHDPAISRDGSRVAT